MKHEFSIIVNSTLEEYVWAECSCGEWSWTGTDSDALSQAINAWGQQHLLNVYLPIEDIA